MSKSAQPVVVDHERLAVGYRLCIRNANEFMRAAGLVRESAPAKALALAELGQEEIGKSFHVLAAFSLPAQPHAWKPFWHDWRNHRRKAHAAYFYETLNPVRISIPNPPGTPLDGLPLRDPITREKEEGLYVEYDRQSGHFVSPAESVKPIEAMSRLYALIALAMTAVQVHDALVEHEPEFRLPAFAEIPSRIMARFTSSREIPALYDEFSDRSAQHAALIARLRSGFAKGLEHLTTIQRKNEQSRAHASEHFRTK